MSEYRERMGAPLLSVEPIDIDEHAQPRVIEGYPVVRGKQGKRTLYVAYAKQHCHAGKTAAIAVAGAQYCNDPPPELH